MDNKYICKDCFYDFRTYVGVTCDHEKDKIRVAWNCSRKMYETTPDLIRLPPKYLATNVKTGRHVAMCNPHIGHCKRDLCLFAHGKAEQRKWNSFLSSGKSGEIMIVMIPKKGYIHEGQLLSTS